MDSKVLEALLISDNSAEINKLKKSNEWFKDAIDKLEDQYQDLLENPKDSKNKFKDRNRIKEKIQKYKDIIAKNEKKIRELQLRKNIKPAVESIEYYALEGLFSSNKNDQVSDAEVKRSQYYNLPDRELATIMVDRLYNNQVIQLATKDDPTVAKSMQMMRLIAYDYFEYNINGIPVAVAKANKNTKEVSFTVYAYIPKTSKYAKGISTPRTELIRSFIQEDKQRRNR